MKCAALHETHVSVVFLVGDRAFKLKKPVRYALVIEPFSITGRELHPAEEEWAFHVMAYL